MFRKHEDEPKMRILLKKETGCSNVSQKLSLPRLPLEVEESLERRLMCFFVEWSVSSVDSLRRIRKPKNT